MKKKKMMMIAGRKDRWIAATADVRVAGRNGVGERSSNRQKSATTAGIAGKNGVGERKDRKKAATADA